MLTSFQPTDNESRFIVLYIESNPFCLDLMTRILAYRPQVTLLTATHERSGLELAQHYHPNLVLLGARRSETSAPEVVRFLHSTPETHNTPVILVSADATGEAQERCFEAGAQGYILKPFNVKALLSYLDTFLSEVQAEKSVAL